MSVHSFFAKTAERVKKRQSDASEPSTSTKAADRGGDDDDDDADFALTAKPTPAAATARTRRKVTANEAPRRESAEVAKSMFFKTPAERAALKEAERERRRAAAEEAMRTNGANRPVHPLFALVASTADRAKAVAESSTSAANGHNNGVANASSRELSLLDSDAAVEVDVESVYGTLAALAVHTDQLQSDECCFSALPSSRSLAWLNVDLELTCGALRHVSDWPAAMAVRSAPQCVRSAASSANVRVLPPPCAAERVAELDGDLIASVLLVPSPFVDAEAGAPIDHPSYKALQRWYDGGGGDAAVPVPAAADIDALFALNGERDSSSVPLGRWLRRYMEVANAAQAIGGAGVGALWSDKYRPMQGNEVAANGDSVRLLSRWLAGWTAPSEVDVEAMPETMLTDDARLRSAVLLVGPEGSCKTSAVYACAARHVYNVIEINAGAARTGRQILQLFSEATQSHNLSATRLGASEQMSGANGHVVVDSDGHSMILFEEIDVQCDDDKGFFAALKTLLASTKRPIVLTCNRLTDAIRDLQESVPELKTMHFVRPELTHTIIRCAFVAFAERRAVSLAALAQLVLARDGDLRRVLHDLQLWCATSTRVSRGAIDGAFGLAHIDECSGGLDCCVRRLAEPAAAALSALDALALEALPLDAVHRIASAYAREADAATLEQLAAAADHLSLCAVAEQRVRESGSLYDADDTHMPEAFDARNGSLVHASVDEDDRWLATPLGFTATLASEPIVSNADADDATEAVFGGSAVAAADDDVAITRRGSVADTPALCGSALRHIHQWAVRAALRCVRETLRPPSLVVALSPLRSAQLSRVRDCRAQRATWEQVAGRLTRRMLSRESRSWNLHYAGVIATNDDESRAAQAGSRRRARPHHFASLLDAPDCHALSRLRIHS